MQTKQTASATNLYYGYIIVIISALILIGAMGIHYAFGVFFKPLLIDFGWSRAVNSGAVSLSWIVQGLASIVMGTLNDKRGPRLVLSLSGFILGMGYILMSQVNSLWQLYLFYGGLVGIGLGGIYIPLTSTVARWFTEKRSIMTGIAISGIGIGTIIAPLVATRLISVFNWRISYAILGIAVMIIVISSAQFLKRAPTTSQLADEKKSLIEKNVEGISLRAAFRTSQFWLIFCLFLCFGITVYVVLIHIVPFATDLGFSPTKAAGLLSTIGGISIIGKIIFGKIGDKLGNRAVYIICFAIMIISFVLLLQIRGICLLYLAAIIFGLSYAGLAASQSPIIASYFGLKSHGAILGIASTGVTFGAAIGPIMAGYIFDINDSYHWAFIISATIAAAGLAFTLALKPTLKSK